MSQHLPRAIRDLALTRGRGLAASEYGASPSRDDSTDALTRIFEYAYANGDEVYFDDVYKVAGSIPYFHDVAKRGPGGVLAAGAPRVFRAEPSTRRNPYSLRQTLYLNTILGNDDNFGIGSGALAVRSLAALNAILVEYGYLAGVWQIEVVGEITAGQQFFGFSNHRSSPLYINGPAIAAWDNNSPPADADATGASIPTAIFRPAVAERGNGAGWAMDFQNNIHVILTNLKGRDWGTKAGNGDEGFARVAGGSMRQVNCHVFDCASAFCARDFSMFQSQGGLISDCAKGFFFVSDARYTLGVGQSIAGQQTAQLVRRCTFGVDAWEGCTGHSDYTRFQDNTVHLEIRKGAHVAMRGETLENTGGFGPSIGIQANDSANYNPDGSQVWVGTHDPRFDNLNGSNNVNRVGYTESLVAWSTTGDQTTSGTNTLTVGSYSIAAQEFTKRPMCLIIEAEIQLNNPNAAANFSFRNAGAFVANIAAPQSPAAFNGFLRIVIEARGPQSQFITGRIQRSNAVGTAAAIAEMVPVNATVDFTAAVTAQLSAACTNAGDTVTVRNWKMWRIG